MENRTKEFLECLGNGKSYTEVEAEDNDIDEYLDREDKRGKHGKN